MKNGIFFLTYDGYYNFTSGVGTQTKTFLSGMNAYYEQYAEKYGDFEINLIVPRFNESSYSFNHTDVIWGDIILNRSGGRAYVCESSLDSPGSDFWTVKNWEKVSASAAKIVLRESVRYDQVLVIAVDPPFLHIPRYLNEKTDCLKIQSVILMYTSTYIHDIAVSKERFMWEKQGLALPQKYKNVKIGDTCKYMKGHFMNLYETPETSFVPFHSSLFLEDFKGISQQEVFLFLEKYLIPKDKEIILAFGRTSWVKGFDTLLEALVVSKKKPHLVLIATQFIEDGAGKYREFIKENNIECTLIEDFTRELPAALCQYKNCKIVVCPSRREPFSNIPLEVALWAKKEGPVILASNIESFSEQIIDHKDGFLFKVDESQDLADKLDYILSLNEEVLSAIRRRACLKVEKERGFFKNFDKLLSSFWSIKNKKQD